MILILLISFRLYIVPFPIQGLAGEYWWQIHDCRTWVTITFGFTMEASETGKTTEDKLFRIILKISVAGI